MTVQELHNHLTKLISEGHQDALVMIGTDDRTKLEYTGHVEVYPTEDIPLIFLPDEEAPDAETLVFIFPD